MSNQTRNQLVLALEPQKEPKIEIETTQELLQALADLLLQAYGGGNHENIEESGKRHELENHV